MVEYNTLEKAAYQQMWDSPFTRVQGLASWLQKHNLVKKMQVADVDANMSYTWAGDHGLLADIDGAAKYLSNIGESYISPMKPPQNHADILVYPSRKPFAEAGPNQNSNQRPAKTRLRNGTRLPERNWSQHTRRPQQ